MLSLKNKKVVDFYKTHNEFDFERVNILIVDFLEKITENKDANRDDILLHSFKKLEAQVFDMTENMKSSSQNIINLQTTIASIPNNLSDNISSKLVSIKENSINEIERVLENNTHKTSDYLDSKLKSIIIENFKSIVDNNMIDLKDTINKSNTPKEFLDSINSNFQSRCDSLQTIMLNQFHNMKDASTSYGETLTNVQNHFDRQKSANYKGIDSENNVEQGLNDCFPDAVITNTTGQPRSGDFWLERTNKDKIMVENKFHSANVTIPDIEKFIRDAEYQNCHGILISQKSGIARKNNFQIDINNGFIMIYIHNMNYDFEKIRLAVSAIEHLSISLKNCGADSCELKFSPEIIKEINNEYQKFLVQRNGLNETLRLFNRDMSKQINLLEFPELSKILSQQFTSTEATLFKCQYCNIKIYKNARGLAKHIGTCNKNKNKDKNKKTTIDINTAIDDDSEDSED